MFIPFIWHDMIQYVNTTYLLYMVPPHKPTLSPKVLVFTVFCAYFTPKKSSVFLAVVSIKKIYSIVYIVLFIRKRLDMLTRQSQLIATVSLTENGQNGHCQANDPFGQFLWLVTWWVHGHLFLRRLEVDWARKTMKIKLLHFLFEKKSAGVQDGNPNVVASIVSAQMSWQLYVFAGLCVGFQAFTQETWCYPRDEIFFGGCKLANSLINFWSKIPNTNLSCFQQKAYCGREFEGFIQTRVWESEGVSVTKLDDILWSILNQNLKLWRLKILVLPIRKNKIQPGHSNGSIRNRSCDWPPSLTRRCGEMRYHNQNLPLRLYKSKCSLYEPPNCFCSSCAIVPVLYCVPVQLKHVYEIVSISLKDWWGSFVQPYDSLWACIELGDLVHLDAIQNTWVTDNKAYY